jgi:NAD/NADP transhydrogenase alpha subunit
MPMMMTAAGTVPAARVFVMGAGVAGLQAIATARRLGAVVTATDVRPAAKEQVESLGAKFIAVEDEEFKQAETSAATPRRCRRSTAPSRRNSSPPTSPSRTSWSPRR